MHSSKLNIVSKIKNGNINLEKEEEEENLREPATAL